MRIAILGVGSIGGLILGALSDSSADLVAFSRGKTYTDLSDLGLILNTPEGSIELIPSDRFLLIDSEKIIPEQVRKSCDVAIICGKASSTPILTQIAEEILVSDGLALTVQNGLGNAEILAHRLGRNRVLAGSITHGAWKDGEGSVHWVGRGTMHMGTLDSNNSENIAKTLLEILNESQLDAIWSDNVQRTVWKKLLLNVSINPVCAIAGVRNGALLEIPELWAIAMDSMNEAMTVASALGVDLSGFDPEDYLRGVVESTANNRCSMLQDVMAGRPTEIDALCGAVVERGESLGIPTPANSALHALVKGVENSKDFD